MSRLNSKLRPAGIRLRVDHEIIDVRSAPNPELTVDLETAPMAPADLRVVTPERAVELFGLAANQSCNPISVPSPYIPFL